MPDAGVQRTILWSKLNLADLRRTITQAAIRDTKAGLIAAPLAPGARLPPDPRGYRTQSWSMSRVQKGWNW